MELKCRCHGLSGSCSLKTCWNRLPDFEQIGAYLKRKYDSSIHLPSAVNVNRLIPMMDRNEISAILLQNNQNDENENLQAAATYSNQVAAAPQFAALTSGDRASIGPPPSSTINSAQLPIAGVASTTVSPHFNYYERHKQLERMAASSSGAGGGSGSQMKTMQQQQQQQQHSQNSAVSVSANGTSQLFLHGDETPISIVPMSQQQYQSLLRDMKLCNTNTSASSSTRKAGASIVQQQQQQQQHALQHRLHRRHLQAREEAAAMVQHHQHQHHHQHATHGKHHHLRKLHHSGEQHHSAALVRHSSGAAAAASGQTQQQQQHAINQLLASQSRDELVHLHKSPDYCEADLRHGFAGVQARTCSRDPLASNSCDRLCCGRGFETRETHIRYNCDCKFQYCCKIHCNYCEKKLVEHVCK